MDEQAATKPAPVVDNDAPTNGDAEIKEDGSEKVAQDSGADKSGPKENGKPEAVKKGEEAGGKATHGFSKQVAAEILRQVRG